MRTLTLIFTFLVCGIARGADLKNEYSIDFRKGNFDNTNLTTLSPGAFRLMLPRKEGLQMLLPSGRKLPTIAISPVFRIRGDFEITASFDFRRPRSPKEGYGCGPTLYLGTHDPMQTAALLGRLSRTENKQVYSTNVSATSVSATSASATSASDTSEGQRENQVSLFDASENRGRLRLVRVGTQLQFLVADNMDNLFRELRSAEFTDADIEMVRLSAQQSDAATPVDVVWSDLTIRAEELPDRPDTLKSGQRRHNATYTPAIEDKPFSLWWSVAAGLALVGLAYGIIRKRRGR